MKTVNTEVYKVNGVFNSYANKSTVEKQCMRSLAAEMGKDYDRMNKRQKATFRYRHSRKQKNLRTEVEVYKVSTVCPQIFPNIKLLKQQSIR
jgi:hypothetical protein